jgi:pimeloyl-ACP methyl ester carboxylesterase
MFSGAFLVPGIACVSSALFAPLVKKLESIGVEGFTPIDIPSVNPKGPLLPNAFEADVTAIREALADAIDSKGLDAVLVGHSYGAGPCLAAAQGLWKTVREREGKKGGVAKVALIAAPLVFTGESVGGLRQEYEKEFGAIEGPPPEFEQTDMVSSQPR